MTQDLVLDSRTDSDKNWASWLYIAHAACFLLSAGMLSFIPLFVNYAKRGGTEGSFVYSHHSWMIRSFWWYLVWLVLGTIFVFTFIGAVIGLPILGIAWLWAAYRLVRGWITLNDNRPI